MDNALLNRTLEFLLLPPANLLFMLLLALLGRKRKPLVYSLLGLGLAQILILSLPISAQYLLKQLEQQYPPQAELWQQTPLPQAIVVLGAGRNRNVPEYGGESTSLAGMERLRYAALLHRKTGLPILLSGGRPLPSSRSEAELMRDVLENEYHIPVRWLEDQSHTTWQNAEYTDQILYEAGIESAWVVTQAWHMPRSMSVYQNHKVNYKAAAVSYSGSIPWSDGYMNWIPQATALERSLIALHEYIGIAWYRLRS